MPGRLKITSEILPLFPEKMSARRGLADSQGDMKQHAWHGAASPVFACSRLPSWAAPQACGTLRDMPCARALRCTRTCGSSSLSWAPPRPDAHWGLSKHTGAFTRFCLCFRSPPPIHTPHTHMGTHTPDTRREGMDGGIGR